MNDSFHLKFGTSTALAFIYVFLTTPETKGQTFEEMYSVLDSGVSAQRASKVESRLDQHQHDIEADDDKIGSSVESAAQEAKAWAESGAARMLIE